MSQVLLSSLALSLILTIVLETGFFLFSYKVSGCKLFGCRLFGCRLFGCKLFECKLFRYKLFRYKSIKCRLYGYKLFKNKLNKKDFLLVILVNVLTNPVVVLLYWIVAEFSVILNTDWNAIIILIPLELFAIFTEGYYYNKYGGSFRYPFTFSIYANLFSFFTGVLLQHLF